VLARSSSPRRTNEGLLGALEGPHRRRLQQELGWGLVEAAVLLPEAPKIPKFKKEVGSGFS
jgi:hypothetical protein